MLASAFISQSILFLFDSSRVTDVTAMESQKNSFATILVARGNDTPPSDLELQLRKHCQKMRVVEKLSGAHLLFPNGEHSLAVRAYDESDVEELNKKFPPKEEEDWENPNDKKQSDIELHDDFDGLHAYRNAFKRTVVLFIIPCNKQLELIDDEFSIFNRAQRTMLASDTQMEKVSRVFLVPNIEAAISAVTSMIDAMKKREAKQLYYDRQRTKYFIPSPDGKIPRSYDVAAAASEHVAEAIHEWAERFDLPPGEGGVLMSMLGSLGEIAIADDEVLSNLPIADQTRDTLHSFFGSKGGSELTAQQPVLVARTPPVPKNITMNPLPARPIQAPQRAQWPGNDGRNLNSASPNLPHSGPANAARSHPMGHFPPTSVQHPFRQTMHNPSDSRMDTFSVVSPPTLSSNHVRQSQYVPNEQQQYMRRTPGPFLPFRRFE